jgi:hypothetical protein
MRRRAGVVGLMVVATAALAVAQSNRTAPTARPLVLSYVPALVAAGFPSAVIHLTVNGQSAWFLVDTGAGVHTWAAWFVDLAGLSARQSKTSALDSTGHEVGLRLVHNVAATLDGGGQLAFDTAAVADFPPFFTDNHIGGLVSPQMLAGETQAAVLDLRVPDLRFEPFETAVTELGAQVLRPPTGPQVCHNTQSQFPSQLYAAPVMVNGVPAGLLVDSGATSTLLVPGSRAAREIGGRAVAGGRSQGVGGRTQTTKHASDVVVRFAGRVMTIDLTIGGVPSTCGPDGLLGMDVLQKCAVILGRNALAEVCDTTRGPLSATLPLFTSSEARASR